MPYVKISIDIYEDGLTYRTWSDSFLIGDGQVGITKRLYIQLCKRLASKLNEYMGLRAKANRDKQLPKS